MSEILIASIAAAGTAVVLPVAVMIVSERKRRAEYQRYVASLSSDLLAKLHEHEARGRSWREFREIEEAEQRYLT